MKRYYLAYNHKGCGDVLIIMFDLAAPTSHHIRHGDISLLYDGPRLIGVNVFDIGQIVKIKHAGIILDPPVPLIDILNQKFDNEGIDVFLPPFVSGFVIGAVTDITNVGARRQATVTLGQTAVVVDIDEDIPPGRKVVIVLAETLLADGAIALQARLARLKDIDRDSLTPDVLPEVPENGVVGNEFFS